jgi:hypothetical protein
MSSVKLYLRKIELMETNNLNYKGTDGVIVSVRIPKTIDRLAEEKAREILSSKSSVLRDCLVKSLTLA